ncbi:MAG: NUDIX domain-containing protein [Candidatus Tyrphobacter sp.]
MTIRIATGIARRDGCVLLVASTYAEPAEPLWTLPGGRQEAGELARDTVVREIREETGLAARIVEFAYAAESYDGETHVASLTFEVETQGELRVADARDHIVDARWVPLDDVAARMKVAVVREPLLAYLRGDQQRYYGFADAGVTIRWLP